MTEQRRLAAIVSADVAGYSRLMGRDESGTLAALKAIRLEVVDPAIASRQDHGRRAAAGVPQRGQCGALRSRGTDGDG
jgi:class 3 adenylate cyclase